MPGVVHEFVDDGVGAEDRRRTLIHPDEVEREQCEEGGRRQPHHRGGGGEVDGACLAPGALDASAEVISDPFGSFASQIKKRGDGLRV